MKIHLDADVLAHLRHAFPDEFDAPRRANELLRVQLGLPAAPSSRVDTAGLAAYVAARPGQTVRRADLLAFLGVERSNAKLGKALEALGCVRWDTAKARVWILPDLAARAAWIKERSGQEVLVWDVAKAFGIQHSRRCGPAVEMALATTYKAKRTPGGWLLP